VTGLTEGQIIETALLYGSCQSRFYRLTMASTTHPGRCDCRRHQQPRNWITGNIGRTGAAPFSITWPVQRDGYPRERVHLFLPGYRKFDNPQDREECSPASGTSPLIASLPLVVSPTLTSSKPLSQGKIKALWFIATNPAVSFPTTSSLSTALRSVEFLVVQDGFQPHPTSDFADLVLPAAIWGEKEGTYTNSERRISKPIPPVRRQATPVRTSTSFSP